MRIFSPLNTINKKHIIIKTATMKIVSWNCNGAFRKKYKELFRAYPDADVFIVQECEDPNFYNNAEYKAIFQMGFHAGTADFFMKGIGVFSLKNLWLRRTKCKYSNPLMMMGYAPFEVANRVKILAVWPHGKYVEEMIDFIALNDDMIANDLLIIGDMNSNSVFNRQHPKGKTHDAMVEMLRQKGLADAYNYTTGEQEGKETIPTFYLQRHLNKPYHLDRAFAAPQHIKSFNIAADHDYWLTLSDHIPIEIDIS